MIKQLLRIIILVMTILPFLTLGFKLYEQESLLTASVYAGIVLILFGTLLIATRVRPAR